MLRLGNLRLLVLADWSSDIMTKRHHALSELEHQLYWLSIDANGTVTARQAVAPGTCSGSSASICDAGRTSSYMLYHR